MDEECIRKDRVMLLREEQNCSHQATHFAEERTVVWFYYKIEVIIKKASFFFYFPPLNCTRLWGFFTINTFFPENCSFAKNTSPNGKVIKISCRRMRVGFAFPACLGAKEQICSQDEHLDDINLTFIDCPKLFCGKQALRNLLSISNRRSSSAWGREVDYGYL